MRFSRGLGAKVHGDSPRLDYPGPVKNEPQTDADEAALTLAHRGGVSAFDKGATASGLFFKIKFKTVSYPFSSSVCCSVRVDCLPEKGDGNGKCDP